MLGSTIIHTTDARLLLLDDLEELLYQDGISYVDLDRLCTLDFSILLADTDVSWNQPGAPLRYHEEEGIAIVEIHPEGIKAFLEGEFDLDPEQSEDLERLREFVAKHGTDNLYEWASF